VTAVSNLGVVLTYLLALPLFGDIPSAWQFGGAALVLAATALLAAGGR
jgi:drug/metabolite transporter (DMT)-like permease